MTAARRTALITGGGKGVGAGIARVLCTGGYRVCINYNSNEAMARATCDAIRAQGGEAFIFQADVSDRLQVRAMVDETIRRYGGLDLLINNAAMQPDRFIDEYDSAWFSWLWDINIGGCYRTLQECLPYLRQSDCASVVNISSVHGKRPSVFDPGYAMTKAAIRMFTREAAVELAHDRITVNAVDLGATRIEHKTGDFKFRMFLYPEERASVQIPLGIVEPSDVGHLVLYLASPGARKMTGSGIRLDGGAMLV